MLQSIQLFDSSPLLSASALLLCFKANPPLHAFLKNKYKFSLAFIHSFQSMQSRVKTLSYISVQTMQFHVANSTSSLANTQTNTKYGPTIRWPLSPSPVVPAPCISPTPLILQSRPAYSKVNHQVANNAPEYFSNFPYFPVSYRLLQDPQPPNILNHQVANHASVSF